MTERQIALVTGANKGIGIEVARQLCKRGFKVWIGARDVKRGVAAEAELRAEGHDVALIRLDVTDEESVDAASRLLTSTVDRLDVLVNNAGVALDAGVAPSQVSMNMARATFDVNVFGCIRVTQAFLPLLRRSKAARIVMVSSDIGSLANQTNPAFPYYALNPMIYSASKAALNAVTIAFAKELDGTAIKVNAANPGFTATDLNEYRGLATVAQGAAPIVAMATLADDAPTGTFLGPDGTEPWWSPPLIAADRIPTRPSARQTPLSAFGANRHG